MENLQGLIGDYYGLDWLTLALGLTGSYLVTGGRLRTGFAFNIIACIAGFSVATMSGQNGFIVYNVLLIALNMRGILRGDRRKPRTIELKAANETSPVAFTQPEAVLVRATAR